MDLAADIAIALLEEQANAEEPPQEEQQAPAPETQVPEEAIPEEPVSEEPAPEPPTEEEPAEGKIPELEEPVSEEPVEEDPIPEVPAIAEDGSYTTKEDVALYIYTYGHLPGNFMTKSEARKLGWEGGGLDRFADGMCIGGDKFGNYEGRLPNAEGRRWTECDIDTLHAKSRGAKRIVFSNDGLIYYTEDHYESFELLYGEDETWN